MRVKRIICPCCESESMDRSELDKLTDYSEEIVSKLCARPKCVLWYDSPEQKLLRALFGDES